MQPMNQDTKYNGVYYVTSSRENLNPVAIRPTVRGNTIQWEDTSRGITLTFTQINSPSNPASTAQASQLLPEKIVLKTPGNDSVTLEKMSLVVYNRFVKDRVAGNPEFGSDQELENYYLTTNFDLY